MAEKITPKQADAIHQLAKRIDETLLEAKLKTLLMERFSQRYPPEEELESGTAQTPQTTIEIQVVETNTGKMFIHAEHSLNIIEGVWELRKEGSSLTIIRNDEVFDQTECIDPCGAHDEGTAFRGLNNLAKETLEMINHFFPNS